jgi:hypothetical protein
MMEMMRRDEKNILDALLIPINANDLLYRNIQYNVLSVANAKDMGVIAMKVFSNGLMYGRKQRGEVIRKIGDPALPSEELIHYTLSTKGVHTLIIGIGEISDDPSKCQLTANLAAAQILPGTLTPNQRKTIEAKAANVLDGKTNDFQALGNYLTPPEKVSLRTVPKGKNQEIIVNWHTAYSGIYPIETYEIVRDGQVIASVPFTPQVTTKAFEFREILKGSRLPEYKVVVVDTGGNSAMAIAQG